MKKLLLLLLLFGFNAKAEKWEYCTFKLRVESGYETVHINLPNRVGIQWMAYYSAPNAETTAKNQKIMQSRLTKENIPYTITDHRPADANELSNALGQRGWEMVSTNHAIVKTGSSNGNFFYFYFKRKLSD